MMSPLLTVKAPSCATRTIGTDPVKMPESAAVSVRLTVIGTTDVVLAMVTDAPSREAGLRLRSESATVIVTVPGARYDGVESRVTTPLDDALTLEEVDLTSFCVPPQPVANSVDATATAATFRIASQFTRRSRMLLPLEVCRIDVVTYDHVRGDACSLCRNRSGWSTHPPQSVQMLPIVAFAMSEVDCRQVTFTLGGRVVPTHVTARTSSA